MKVKQTIFLVFAMMLLSVSFAQNASKPKLKFPVVIAESGIRSITISDNIDLLLLNAEPDNIKASVPNESLGKLKVDYSRGNLRISTKGYLQQGERISLYVYVNELESLTLRGNSFAGSRDVLDLGNLRVNIEDNGRVSLKSRGKIKLNAPDQYRKVEEERYHLLFSTE